MNAYNKAQAIITGIEKVQNPGEKKLASAVISRALRDLRTLKRKKKTATEKCLTKDVIKWFNNDEIFPSSFAWYCMIIKVDHVRLRKAIMLLTLHELEKLSRELNNC